ncbi:MAG: arsenate reductase [Bacteroidetes bacterium]|jgi:arsenate reductase|nr:arsenate reductase [Bacteroidota bacterium]
MILYFNPECSKCNEAKDLLERNNCELQIRNYLEFPPSEKELKELLKKLNCNAIDLVRKKERLYIEKYEGQYLCEDDWIKILSENPVLIERPILIDTEKAIIGRPPVLVLDLLKK